MIDGARPTAPARLAGLSVVVPACNEEAVVARVARPRVVWRALRELSALATEIRAPAVAGEATATPGNGAAVASRSLRWSPRRGLESPGATR